jgi:hypothetical protein
MKCLSSTLAEKMVVPLRQNKFVGSWHLIISPTSYLSVPVTPQFLHSSSFVKLISLISSTALADIQIFRESHGLQILLPISTSGTRFKCGYPPLSLLLNLGQLDYTQSPGLPTHELGRNPPNQSCDLMLCSIVRSTTLLITSLHHFWVHTQCLSYHQQY